MDDKSTSRGNPIPGSAQRFLSFGTAWLGLALVLLAGLFLRQARRFGGERWIPWPLVGSLIALLLLLAVTLPAPLGSPATAADYSSFTAQFE